MHRDTDLTVPALKLIITADWRHWTIHNLLHLQHYWPHQYNWVTGYSFTLVPGLFIPWTIRTLDYSYHRWTIRTLDCTYRGLFVPWTVCTVLGLFVPWTVLTVDCSYPLGLFVPWTVRTLLDCSYHGLFVPSLDDSYHVARLTKINTRTMDVSYQNVPVYKLCRLTSSVLLLLLFHLCCYIEFYTTQILYAVPA